MDRVLLVIGDAAEVLDTMYPLFRLREAGYAVDVAGTERRGYHLVQHDRNPDWDITVESPGYRLAADVAFRDVRAADYAGLVVSGGRALEYLRYDADLVRLTREFAAAGGLISYGASVAESYLLAGVYTGRILRGEKPGDLPVQRSSKLEIFVNLKTARALDIAIPQGLIITADEVFE